MTTPRSTSIAMPPPPPHTMPKGTLIVNCLIMLTPDHETEDGSHFLFVPSSSSGFPDRWVERAVRFQRGTGFFFNALDVHRGSGIPKASPTGPQALKDETSDIPVRERLPSASRAQEKDFDLTSTIDKVFLTSPPFQRQFVDCLKDHVPTVRTPGGPPLWVVVHVMVKCIEGLCELWRVREMYSLTQVELHRALTTKFSKAWGDSGWSPTRWIHWCLA